MSKVMPKVSGIAPPPPASAARTAPSEAADASLPESPAPAPQARPRLFLARDRVRRLPSLDMIGEEPDVQVAGYPDGERSGERAGQSGGPRLFSPGGAMPESILADAAPLSESLPASRTPHAPAADRLDATSRKPMLPPSVVAEDARAEPAAVARGPRVEYDAPTVDDPASHRPLAGASRPEGGGVSWPVGNEPRAAQTPRPKAPQPAGQATERSSELERIAREADRHTREGFELAGRKAFFAARAEFIVALRLVAQALDADEQTTSHSEALAVGLRAIDEADDFIPTGSRLEADLNLGTIIDSHRTTVLKSEEPGAITPMTGLRAYFTFAQRRLAEAAGGEAAGSIALHGLGKLHVALVSEPTAQVIAAESKAMTFFQAALLTYPNNLMAANDLGVLLARAGHWRPAKRMLEHAVTVNPKSASWRNLAKVYQRLGETEKAEYAKHVVARLDGGRAAADSESAPHVVWLDPNQFAGTHARQNTPPVPAHQVRRPAHAPSTPRTGSHPRGFPSPQTR